MEELNKTLNSINEMKFDEDTENLLTEHPSKPRMPPDAEVPISTRPEDYFKDENGNMDFKEESKNKAFQMMMGYIKALQIQYSDKITALKIKDFTDEEAKMWHKAMNEVCKNIVTQFSYLELIELHDNTIQQKKDEDGNIIPDEIEIKPESIQPHLRKFPDGSIGVVPQLMAKEIAKKEKVNEYFKKLDEDIQEKLDEVEEEKYEDLEFEEVEELS